MAGPFFLQCEAVSQCDKEEKNAATALLDAFILKQQARRWASSSLPTTPKDAS